MAYHSKLTLFILGCFLLFSCKPTAQEISVMTYNVYHGENPYNLGTSNLDEVADIINAYHPDFVALQEVDSMTRRTAGFNEGRRINVAEELGRLTGMQGHFGKAIDFSDGGYGEGLLIRHVGTPFPHRKVMLPIPKGGEDRAVLMVQGEIADGQEIIFAGTHLCHQFDENRVAQAKELVRYFKDQDEPVILCGDFNFEPDSEAYQIMTEYFDDAAVLFGEPQNTFSAKDPRIRIDFIFLSKNQDWKVQSLEVLDEDASDHKPVVAKIEFR